MEILLSWSGGKDCSLALHYLRTSGMHRVRALLTTFTEGFDRVSMHGVRRSLLHEQAEAVGLPLEEVWIPKDSSNQVYEERMTATLSRLRSDGIEDVAFGDLFLRDIREYREAKLAQLGMRGVFPLWGRDTKKVADDIVGLGFKSILVCVDPRKLDISFCGREFDASFLYSLPRGIDPCGENGEFHTFVYDGPIFSEKVLVRKGETVSRDGFCFTDLVPLG